MLRDPGGPERVHQHASTVTFAAICHRPVINKLGNEIMDNKAAVLIVPMREALSADNQKKGKVSRLHQQRWI